MTTIGFVGAGNMARALGGGLRSAWPAGQASLIATDVDAAARERFAAETGGSAIDDPRELCARASVVILAVKPQVVPQLLPRLAPVVEARHLVISIAAGITLRALSSGLGGDVRLVRAMPNTPALIREGATVLAPAASATAADRTLAESIFRSVGDVLSVDDEGLLDAVTALSGSGPGFLFAYAEAMLKAAETVGLPADLALRLLQRTLLGSAKLWLESGEPVEKLRAMVTSPGGTTQAGLEALAGGGFAGAIGAAIEAATRRSRELSGS